MIVPAVSGPVTPGEPLFAPAAGLFGAYRAHYGRPVAPEATLRRPRDQVTRGRLRIDAHPPLTGGQPGT